MRYSQKINRINLLLVIILATTFSVGVPVLSVEAAGFLQPEQQVNPQPSSNWSTPLNLSRSGGTTKPMIFTDSRGTTHALWKDTFAKLVYSKSTDAINWDKPVPLVLPFSDFNYQILSAPNGRIYAFWIDNENRLIVNSVEAPFFNDPSSWEDNYVIRNDTYWFNATIDSARRLHLIFLKVSNTESSPSGVYYTSSSANATSWSSPNLIYSSPYYRTLQIIEGPRNLSTPIESKVQLDIKSVSFNENNILLAAWDNPSLKRVFFSRSTDGGRSWQEASVVDGPTDNTPYLSAEKIHLYSSDGNVLRIWQAVESGGVCTQKFQASQDGGETWSPADFILKGNTNCTSNIQTFPLPENMTLVFASLQNRLFLMAWNGQQWSPPEEQTEIGNFIDPDNFNPVLLNCQQAAIFENKLIVIGCDQGLGGDIWTATYEIGDVSQWFTKPTGWSKPYNLSLDSSPITALTTTTDSQSNIHILVSQPDSQAGSAVQLKTNVSYSGWNTQDSFIGPYPIFDRLDGVAKQFSLINYPPTNKIFLTWSGGQSGEIYFSWALIDQATRQSGWAPPILIGGTSPGHEPSLAISPGGVLYAIYAIPLNEQRGIYLTSSNNEGRQWTTPVQIYDGSSDNCDMVEQPSISVIDNNNISALWVCSTIPGGIGPLSLMASRSTDAGQSWMPAEVIVSGSVTWNRIIKTPSKVHRLWQEYKSGKTSIWHSISENNGVSWQPQKNIFTSASEKVFTDIIPMGEQLFLTHLIQEDGSPMNLDFLLWNGQNWIPKESLQITNSNINNVSALSSIVTPSNSLVVTYTHSQITNLPEGNSNQLTLVSLPVELSSVNLPVINPPVDQNETNVTPTPEITEEPVVNPTMSEVNTNLIFGDESRPANSNMGLLIAIAVPGIIVMFVVVIRLLIIRAHRF